MTVVNITITRPQPSGVDAPVTGWLQWTPTAVQHLSPEVVLPVGFQVDLSVYTATVAVNVAATGPGWCWRVDTHVIGLSPVPQYFAVPSSGPVAFADLVQVDPKTLQPSAAPAPAWYAYVDNVVAAVGSQASLDGGNAASTYDGQFNFDGGTA